MFPIRGRRKKMAGNSPLKASKMERRHIIIPRYLDEAVKKSAEASNRSYSAMVVTLLQKTYGKQDKYEQAVVMEEDNATT
jgi:hypothetical protein